MRIYNFLNVRIKHKGVSPRKTLTIKIRPEKYFYPYTDNPSILILDPSDKQVTLRAPGSDRKTNKMFTFDSILGPTCPQPEVYTKSGQQMVK